VDGKHTDTPRVPSSTCILRRHVAYSFQLDPYLTGNKSLQHTFVDVDIHDEDIYADVEYFRDFLWAELRFEVQEMHLENSLNLDEVQLVLEPRADNVGVLCCYYFVNPVGRSLFWLDEWDAPGLFNACRGVSSIPHKGKPHIY